MSLDADPQQFQIIEYKMRLLIERLRQITTKQQELLLAEEVTRSEIQKLETERYLLTRAAYIV